WGPEPSGARSRFHDRERQWPRRRRQMSKRAKIAVGGVAVGLILWIWLPLWAVLLIVLGVPAAAYLTLDPSQRRRLRRVARKELGR
ncbi:LOW QUALITY PROTEIN: integral membrane protein, partial [Streptomyces sp. e14]